MVHAKDCIVLYMYLHVLPSVHEMNTATHSGKLQCLQEQHFPRTIPIWNEQPAKLIEQDTLDGFSSGLAILTLINYHRRPPLHSTHMFFVHDLSVYHGQLVKQIILCTIIYILRH